MADLLHRFFAANNVIVLSLAGQVFFVVGLVVATQRGQHSRLPLARNLKWLAAFGFTKAFHQWGDVFIPLQSQYLPPPLVALLLEAQALLLAASFACLFQFGLKTWNPTGRIARARHLAAVSLGVWIAWALGPAMASTSDIHEWHRLATVAARYSLGFPGAMVAAFGLRREASQLTAPLQLPRIWRMLRVAGIALAGYAVAGGLVVPAAGFFPADRMNEELVLRATLVPISVYRSVFGLGLAVATVRALTVFDAELDSILARMARDQAQLRERERIGRELHDGTLQNIYAAGLLLQVLQDSTPGEAAAAHFSTTVGLLDRAAGDIRAYIGTLAPSSGTAGLAEGLRGLAAEGYLRSMVAVDLDLDLATDRHLPPDQVAHALAVMREAVNNVVRHADARHVRLRARGTGDGVVLEVEDDGRGIPRGATPGTGLRNMRDRARLLDGRLDIAGRAGGGTVVTLIVPWPKEQ